MATRVDDRRGKDFTIRPVIGLPYTLTVSAVDSVGAPYSLTGRTVEANIWNGRTVVQAFSVTTGATRVLSLTAAQIAALETVPRSWSLVVDNVAWLAGGFAPQNPGNQSTSGSPSNAVAVTVGATITYALTGNIGPTGPPGADAVGNIDGGTPSSIYTSTAPIDGGGI